MGIVECGVINIPSGIGDPFFDSVESTLSHLLFSVPAVKGVEFGAGFDFARMKGSSANDEFYIDDSRKVRTYSNNNGGILGGITNSMPLIFRVAFKPTPSIGKLQRTVDLSSEENTTIKIDGRHDPCIVQRAVPVVEAVTAMVNNTIREFVTIHRGTEFGGKITEIGEGCFLMAYTHIAHDCIIGRHVVMANNATLAGHIHIGDYATIGGLSAIHQFARVGEYAFIGGMTAVPKDVPPYVLASGERARLHGLNTVGLKRHGFSKKSVSELKKAYRIIFRIGLTLKQSLERVKAEVEQVPEVVNFIEFIQSSSRGITR